MKQTPLYEKHIEDGGKIVEFAGFMMPIQFEGILDEHGHVRSKVGVFDVSHMGETFVSGEEATEFLDHLLTNNINTMKDMSCIYTIMCYDNGNVVDDLLVYRYHHEKYLLVLNASNDEKDVAWIKEQATSFNVTIDSKSDFYGELAVQGPLAEALLSRIFGEAVVQLPFFHFLETEVLDIPVIISRTGYTGEDGYEIFVESDNTLRLYTMLFQEAQGELKPIGLGARDTLRFEVALPLYGHELSDTINPVEARLTYFIDFDKEDFIGKEALLKTKADNNHRFLIGFMLKDKGIAREGASILNEDMEVIGFVTTGYQLKGYEHAIGLGYVPKNYSNLGDKIFIQVRKNQIEANIVSRKFLTKNYKK